jgi:type III secretory pathway component EscV
LGRTCRARLRDIARYRAVDAAWDQLAGASAHAGDALAADLQSAHRELVGFLDEAYQLAPGPEPDTIPLPLALEIADPLIPTDPMDRALDRWPLFTRFIPGLKDRIEQGMGVALPGIRVRPLATPPETPDRAEYMALIDEVPVRRGTVPLEHLFCPVDPEQLRQAGIPPGSITPARHPVTGDPGAWLPREHRQTLEQRGLEIWDDPLQYIVVEMEAAIVRNLSRFVDLSEVSRLVTSWCASDGASREVALANAGGSMGLRAILRALVEGRVSIKNGQPVLAPLLATAERLSTTDAVRAIRLGLKEVLPGNRPSDRVHRLLPGCEDRLSRARAADDGRAPFGPEDGLEVLRALRSEPGLDHPRAVVMVGQSSGRRSASRLGHDSMCSADSPGRSMNS